MDIQVYREHIIIKNILLLLLFISNLEAAHVIVKICTS